MENKVMRMGNVRKLTEEEIQDMFVEYSKNHSPEIRDEVVLQYTNLVESIGRRFVGANEPLEDLVQEGYIGLIASVDKYDGDKGVKFSTYATHFIIGQIKHYLRDKGKIIKEPAWLQELNQRMTKVIESLNQQYNRQPTEKEISDVMQMPESTVQEMLTTREVFKVSSLDGDKDDSPSAADTEKISDEKVETFQLPLEDKIVLETALDHLKDIEQQVISDHYYKGLNQTEIAKKLNISCNYVSHILRNGTKKLRKILATEEIRDNQMQRTLVSKRVKPGESLDNSIIDSTTGTYKYQYYMERLDEEISRAYRNRSKLAIMLLQVSLPDDLDQYTRIVRMDDYLYTIGQAIKDNIRKSDLAARFGESCFALLLPHTASQVNVISERLDGLIRSTKLDSGRRRNNIFASVQIGTAKYPHDAFTSRDLLNIAADDIGISLDILQSIKQQSQKKAA